MMSNEAFVSTFSQAWIFSALAPAFRNSALVFTMMTVYVSRAFLRAGRSGMFTAPLAATRVFEERSERPSTDVLSWFSWSKWRSS